MPGLEIGDLFADRYEIVEQLGRGGMGMVYRVKDWKYDRTRALKTLLPQYAENPQAVRRFIREVNAASQIQHPCVVRMFEARKHDGMLYYTMEYVRGKSLRTWIRERKEAGRAIGFGSTVRVVSMLCSALEEAHKFTVHRDISPENVMVTSKGDVKLLDFGLAKLDDIHADLTRVGISLGKIQYNSPEQRADAKNVDHRADLYSLGVMLFEMLTGELPLGGKKISELVPGLPPEVDAFYAKATAPDPADRFQTAREFRKMLTALYREIDGANIPSAAIPANAAVPAAAPAGPPTSWTARFASRLMRWVPKLRRP